MSGGGSPVQVKLCGIRTLEHARAAVDLGVEYVSFILAPGYRRTVPPELVREITASLGPGAARYVGVFVDPDPAEAGRIARYAGLDLVQLAGDERPEDVRAVGVPAFKVVHVLAGADPLPEVERYAEVAEMVVLDTHSAAGRGGTGTAFPWALARAAAHRYPVMLAGGLHAGNVAEAIRVVGPRAVDVSSGIESVGTKDPEKMAAFVRAARTLSACHPERSEGSPGAPR